METILDKKSVDITGDYDTKFKELRDEVKDLRKDFLIVFGIFASILTFLSIEVQVFRQAENLWEIVGVSSFVLSTILVFVTALNFTVTKPEGASATYLKNPVLVTALVFLMIGVLALNQGSSQKRVRGYSHPCENQKWGKNEPC